MPRADDPLYYGVYEPSSNTYGFAWRLGASGSSFYLKTRYSTGADLKISLHGPEHMWAKSMYFAYLDVHEQAESLALGLRNRHKFFGNEVVPGSGTLFVSGAPGASSRRAFRLRLLPTHLGPSAEAHRLGSRDLLLPIMLSTSMSMCPTLRRSGHARSRVERTTPVSGQYATRSGRV